MLPHFQIFCIIFLTIFFVIYILNRNKIETNVYHFLRKVYSFIINLPQLYFILFSIIIHFIYLYEFNPNSDRITLVDPKYFFMSGDGKEYIGFAENFKR
jgi:hypothetical protein